MWFLLLEIFLLLTLAALFGSWLTHWWLKRNYEDVTESYASMASKNDISIEGLLTKSEFDSGLSNLGGTDLAPVEKRLGSLETMIGGFTVPETDLSPIEERLLAVESLLTNPQTDDTVSTRFSGLESSLTALHASTSNLQNTDTSRLERQMDLLATAIADREDTDLAPVEARLAGLEDAVSAIRLPDTDLGPIHSGLTRLEMSLANMDAPTSDLGPIETRINALQETIASHNTNSDDNRETILQRLNVLSSKLGDLQNTDITPLSQRLDDIETRIAHIHMPEPDLSSVDEGLGIIHGRLSNLENRMEEQSRKQVDLGFLQQRMEQVQGEISRLERMELKLASMQSDIQAVRPNLDPLEQRMIMVQNGLDKQTDPDLTPILNSVYAMEQRMDFAAMENRLTSIEYGLAAMHHMLRTRQTQETSSYRAPTNPQDVAPPRTSAPQYQPPRQTTNHAPPPSMNWGEQMPMPRPFDVPDMPEQSGYDFLDETSQDYDDRDAERERNRSRDRSRNRDHDRNRNSDRSRNRDRDRNWDRSSSRSNDAVNEARRPDDKANLLVRPAFGAPDDLEEISGVGPMLNGLLSEIGVYYFWQVAEWGPAEIEWVDSMLDGFNGRIERDDWVGQAKVLATGANAARRP